MTLFKKHAELKTVHDFRLAVVADKFMDVIALMILRLVILALMQETVLAETRDTPETV